MQIECRKALLCSIIPAATRDGCSSFSCADEAGHQTPDFARGERDTKRKVTTTGPVNTTEVGANHSVEAGYAKESLKGGRRSAIRPKFPNTLFRGFVVVVVLATSSIPSFSDEERVWAILT